MIAGNFQKSLSLADKGDYRIRLLRPEDKSRLLAGFEQLSPESRYQRFFVVKNELTETDLRLLTEYDEHEQVALGVFELDGDIEGMCVAGGRIVRNPRDHSTGEVGITVIDRMQHQGLGRLLVELLIEAAGERAMERLRFDVMADNKPMRNLIKQLAPQARFENQGDFLSADVPIATQDQQTGEKTDGSAMVRLLCAMIHVSLLGPVCLRLATDSKPDTPA